MKKHSFFGWITSLPLAFAAVLVVLILTDQGIGLFGDDWVYFQVAQTMQVSGVFTHPPLYGLTLGALMRIFELSPESSAKLLNIILLPLCLLTLTALLSRLRPDRMWLIWITGWIVLFSYPMLHVFALAASEPLFLLLSSLTILLLVRGAARPQPWVHVALAGIVCGLAFFTRYAGASLVIFGAFVLLSGNGSMGRRIAQAMLYGFISSLPTGLLMLANRFSVSSGVSTGRSVDLAGMSQNYTKCLQEHLPQLSITITEWFAPYRVVEWVGWPVAGLLVSTGIFAILISGWRAIRYRRDWAIVVGWPVFYLLFVVAWLMVSGESELDLSHRILVPTFFWLIPSVFLSLFDVAGKSVVRNRLAIAAMVLVSSVGVVRGYTYTKKIHAEGLGLGSVVWRSSPTLQYAMQQPEHTLFYSNAPEALHLLGGIRSPMRLPAKQDYWTGAENENIQVELQQLRLAIREENAQVIIFRIKHPSDEMYPPYLTPAGELQRTLELDILRDFGDGYVMGYAE